MGRTPRQATADQRVLSVRPTSPMRNAGDRTIVAPDRQKHREKRPPRRATALRRPAWPNKCGTSCARQKKAVYKLRKRWWTGLWTIKEAARVSGDSCCEDEESAGGMADDLRHHNLLKLFRSGREPPEGLKTLAQPGKLIFPAA